MDNNITIFMEIALEVIIATIIIGAIMATTNLISESMSIYQKDVDRNYQMELYDKYSAYDDTVVSGADVISSIFLHTSSDFQIKVGTYSYNSPSVSIADLESHINPVNNYNASLILNDNDAIVGLQFE